LQKFYFRRGAAVLSRSDELFSNSKTNLRAKTSPRSCGKVGFNCAAIPFIAAVEDNRAPHTTTLRHSPVSK